MTEPLRERADQIAARNGRAVIFRNSNRSNAWTAYLPFAWPGFTGGSHTAVFTTFEDARKAVADVLARRKTAELRRALIVGVAL